MSGLCNPDVLISEDAIKARVAEIGKQISADFKDRRLLLVGVLKGAVVFLADLLREIDTDVDYDFVALSSYNSETQSSGIVRITKDIDADLRGKSVLIVEDIVDTGWTIRISYLRENMIARGADDVKICALLDKPSGRKVDIGVDYRGFVIEDLFVVGYGLDYNGMYRNLPYIGVLTQS